MDSQKDIQKGDDFSKFVDAQPVKTDPFGSNRVAERLYRRAERVTAALYLLTRHISSDEPIRQEIRLLSMDLFKKVLQLKDEIRATESNTLLTFQSAIRNLISLCRMLTAGGFVSFQNADTVIAALDELGTFTSYSQRSSLAEGVSFSKEDLMGDMSPLSDSSERSVRKDIKDKKYVKDTSVSSEGPFDSSERGRSGQSSARNEGILIILRSGDELGIKDICSRLPDYSEKMIQRSLADLVRLGQVQKKGSKRWSLYSLPN